MAETIQFLTFKVGRLSLALAADRVERVVRAALIAPSPQGPDVLLGIANVAGTLLPVFDMGLRLESAPTRVHPGHIFIITKSALRRMILVVDSVSELVDGAPGDFIAHDQLSPGISHVSGMLKREDGLLWIQDLDRFLSLEEEAVIDKALLRSASGSAAPEKGRDAA